MDFNPISLIVCVLVCQAVGIVGGIFTAFSEKAWFKTLRKSALQPPSRVMGLVWIGLYTLMGTALYLVWRMPPETPGRTITLILFAVQLLLGDIWPLFFFKVKHPLVAFVESVVTWVFVLGTAIAFAYLSVVTLFFWIPVWIWVSFEAYLNFSMMSLNDEPVATVHP